MNVFNRALVIALLVISGAFWALVIALALLYPDSTVAALRNVVSFMEGQATSIYLRAMLSLVAGVLILLSILLLLVEFSPSGAGDVIPLTGISSGSAVLAADAVIQRIKYDVEALPEVVRVAPSVRPQGKMVDVHLDLHLEPVDDISAKAEEACRAVRAGLEGKMGLKINKLTTTIHLQRASGKPSPA